MTASLTKGQLDERGYEYIPWKGLVDAGVNATLLMEVGRPYRVEPTYCSCTGCGKFTHYEVCYSTHYVRENDGVHGIWTRCPEHEAQWEAEGGGSHVIGRTPEQILASMEMVAKADAILGAQLRASLCPHCFTAPAANGACNC